MSLSFRPLRPWIVGTAACAAVAAALSAPPASAAPTPVTPAAAATVTHLITGDTVGLRTLPDGRSSLQVDTAARTGPGAAWSGTRVAGRSYVFPAVAKPYLGRILDPSLFEITGDTGRVPVDLTFAAGSKPAVPGFTATSSTATTAHGYVTASSARQFGAALLARWKIDAAPGHTPVTSLFGVTHIARSGATTPAQPSFPQITLVIAVKNPDGTPADGASVSIVNTDDARKYSNFVFVSGGEARVSVPLGHYSALVESGSFDPATSTFADRLVTVPDVTVSKNLQRLTVNTAAATVTPTVSTPQSAAVSQFSLEWDRIIGQSSISSSFTYGPGSTVKIAPAAAPRYGRSEWLTGWTLDATPPHALPYRYDLTFDDSGAIPADQHRTVSTAQLARLDSAYHTDGPARLPLFGRAPAYPFQFFIFSSLVEQPGPLSRTEYVGGPPSTAWFDTYVALSTPDNFLAGLTSDGLRLHPAGSRETVDWLRGPLAPGVDSPTDGSNGFYSTACRSGDKLAIALAPFTDTTPGHYGSAFITDPTQSVATFTLRQNGAKVRFQNNSTGGVFSTTSAPSSYSATVETFLEQNGFSTSSHAVTTLTFRSGTGQGTPLPDGWQCAAGPDATTLPLLQATVPLPTDLANTMPIGPNRFSFAITPAPGAPSAQVVDVQLRTSLDGGATFTPAPVTALGGNRFGVTVTNSGDDAGRAVTVQVSGRTAAGSAISETVTNAYVIQGSQPS